MNTKLLSLFLFVSLTQCVHSKDMPFFIIRDLKCKAVDTTFCRFDICGEQIGKDGVKNFNMILRLLKVPVTNCKLQFEFKTVTDISIPISYNNTFDACKFMENRSKYRVLQRIYDTFGGYVNINHTCPYNHDIIVKGLKGVPVPFDIPWPNGIYDVLTSWIVDKKIRLTVNVILEVFKKKKN